MDIEVGPVLESISTQAPTELKPFFADFHALYEQNIPFPSPLIIFNIILDCGIS